MADKSIISELLGKMLWLPKAPVLESKEKADQLTDFYMESLGDLDNNAVRVAVNHYCSTSTFFPTPGDLRMKALDLYVMAAAIPSPAEAWGQVLKAVKHRFAVVCQEGADLRENREFRPYWESLARLSIHEDNCAICSPGGFHEEYGHAIVAETVRLLGGRDAIFTDNEPADRAQFIKAYEKIVDREKTKAGMTPETREFVAEKRVELSSGKTQGLISSVTRKLEA